MWKRIPPQPPVTSCVRRPVRCDAEQGEYMHWNREIDMHGKAG